MVLKNKKSIPVLSVRAIVQQLEAAVLVWNSDPFKGKEMVKESINHLEGLCDACRNDHKTAKRD